MTRLTPSKLPATLCVTTFPMERITMQYLSLPGIALPLSRIALGTGGYGSSTPADEAFRLLDGYAAVGGNVLDTAHVYAAWLPNGVGASERTLGAWMRARGMRGQMCVSSKGAHPDMQTGEKRLRYATLASDVAESLERLQSDSIDLYFLHRDDSDVPIGEILGWLGEHVAAGRMRAIGCSNWHPARIRAAADYAAAHGCTGFCVNQIGWSLGAVTQGELDDNAMRYLDAAGYAYHCTSRLPIMAYSSQANGFFSGKYGPGDPAPARHAGVEQQYGGADNYRRQRLAAEIAIQYGVSMNQVALAYLFGHPFPAIAIVGPHSDAQLTDSCAAGDITLTAEEVARLRGH